MELQKAKSEFIATWGTVGSTWGIPRTMAQIHALLLTNKDGLSAEDVMDRIQSSRGNVNTNLRELINWGLVIKQTKLGERKEYFKANHNIWQVAQNIIEERKKREFLPIKNLITSLSKKAIEGDNVEVSHFTNLLKELDEFLEQMDQLSALLVKMNGNTFFKQALKLLK